MVELTFSMPTSGWYSRIRGWVVHRSFFGLESRDATVCKGKLGEEPHMFFFSKYSSRSKIDLQKEREKRNVGHTLLSVSVGSALTRMS